MHRTNLNDCNQLPCELETVKREERSASLSRYYSTVQYDGVVIDKQGDTCTCTTGPVLLYSTELYSFQVASFNRAFCFSRGATETKRYSTVTIVNNILIFLRNRETKKSCFC